MSRLCLDTSAYSWLRRGDPAVVEIVTTAKWVGVPALVKGELQLGYLLGSQEYRGRNQALLREFLANPVVHELPVDGEVAMLYADMLAQLSRAGSSVPTNDIWIAATAANAGALVLTYDSRFERIRGVGARILPPPTPA